MNYDPLFHPYPAYRTSQFATKGVVATSQALAAQAGLDILKKGGNAIDAAIATAAALTVVEPCSNGIGGDAFALVWVKDQLYGLNASGPAPKGISIEALKARGYSQVPDLGPIPITVPGAPSAWAALSKRFGKLSLKETLQPAITLAEEGFAVSAVVASAWKESYDRYKNSPQNGEFDEWFKVFSVSGEQKPPQAGQIWSSPDHAATLRAIAETDGEVFYRGELAERIASHIQSLGGYLSVEDLQDYQAEWVDPIKTNYRGYDVWEIPPNGQGLVALLALQLLNQYESHTPGTVESYHRQIEAMKLAFADGQHYITDYRNLNIAVEELLSEDYAAERFKLIGETASLPKHGEPKAGGTVYLATADDEGNMVSFIQSNYMKFGSGVVIPNTGIALQNRGKDFSLNEHDANVLAPGKKTYHTIIPGFLTKDNQAVGPFGVMGGIMQPQGHVQVIMNTIDYDLHPQAAIDAPRWQWIGGKTVLVEPQFPAAIAQALARKGHDIKYALDSSTFGRGQIIWRNHELSSYIAGTDSRADGVVAAW